MSEFEKLLRGDELNLPRPCNPIAIQRELTQICRGHGVEVRLVWSVDLNRCALGGRIWKKYGLKTWRQRLLGHKICVPDTFGKISINGQRYRLVRYEPPTTMLAGVPAIRLPGEIALPDMIIEENVFSRWMIEWRMPDEIAKPHNGAITTGCRLSLRWKPTPTIETASLSLRNSTLRCAGGSISRYPRSRVRSNSLIKRWPLSLKQLSCRLLLRQQRATD